MENTSELRISKAVLRSSEHVLNQPQTVKDKYYLQTIPGVSNLEPIRKTDICCGNKSYSTSYVEIKINAKEMTGSNFFNWIFLTGFLIS